MIQPEGSRERRRLVIGLVIGMALAIGVPAGSLALVGSVFHHDVGHYSHPPQHPPEHPPIDPHHPPFHEPPHASGVNVAPSHVVAVAGVPGVYVVNLLSQPTAPVRVLLQSDSSLVRVNPSSLVFTPGVYAIPRIVTVSATGSSSGLTQTTIKHVVESADPFYNGMRVSNVIVMLAGLVSSSANAQSSAPARTTHVPAAVEAPAAEAPEAPADAPAEPASCLGILPVNLRVLQALC